MIWIMHQVCVIPDDFPTYKKTVLRSAQRCKHQNLPQTWEPVALWLKASLSISLSLSKTEWTPSELETECPQRSTSHNTHTHTRLYRCTVTLEIDNRWTHQTHLGWVFTVWQLCKQHIYLSGPANVDAFQTDRWLLVKQDISSNHRPDGHKQMCVREHRVQLSCQSLWRTLPTRVIHRWPPDDGQCPPNTYKSFLSIVPSLWKTYSKHTHTSLTALLL